MASVSKDNAANVNTNPFSHYRPWFEQGDYTLNVIPAEAGTQFTSPSRYVSRKHTVPAGGGKIR